MSRNRLTVLVVVPLLFSACASVPTGDIEFEAEADPKARFQGYKSYTWLLKAAALRDPEGRWKPPGFDADAEIKFLIDRELRGRGMSENSAKPDLFVAFAIGVDMLAAKLKSDPETKKEILANVPAGGLAIALVDAETGLVVWAGVANSKLLKDPDEATVKARLDYAVTNLLEQVPD
ncbi:MAG: DUF4136 domain-containing protein [Planctomycetota bacterium]